MHNAVVVEKQPFPFVLASSKHARRSFCPWQIEHVRLLLRSETSHFLLLFIHFRKHLKYIVNVFQAKDDVIPHLEMNSKTVNLPFFQLEETFLRRIRIFEIQNNVSSRTFWSHHFNFQNLHLCSFVLLQCVFFYVA